MDPDRIAELVEQIGSDTPPNDADLAIARTELATALRDAAAAEQPDLDAARSLRATIDKIDAEIADRAARTELERAEMATLLDGLDDKSEPDDNDDASEDSPAPEAVAESEPEAVAEPVEQPTPEPVAASTNAQPAIEHLRRRAHQATTVAAETPVGAFRGIGNASSRGVLHSMREVAETFAAFGRDNTAKTTLVRAEYEHPRMLGPDAVANMDVVNAAVGPVVASGGICPPIGARFDQTVCGDRGRPIRDALPSFGSGFGGRGGVAFPPPLVFGDLSGAITVWDEATDAAPGSEVKACVRIDCGPETTVLVDAIAACVTIGNFQARFNSEQWAAALSLLAVEHDAIAEATLYATIRTAGLRAAAPVAGVDETNTAQTVFVNLAKAAARYRSSQRLLPTTTLRFLTSTWLRDAIAASLDRQPVGEGFGSSYATIDSYFAGLNIAPVYSPDIQRLAAQADATLDELTTPAEGVLYSEGSVLFLDGGTLDLGTEITDSTLNATNDRQAFMETFEAVGIVGCAPLTLTFPVADACVCV